MEFTRSASESTATVSGSGSLELSESFLLELNEDIFRLFLDDLGFNGFLSCRPGRSLTASILIDFPVD